MTLLTQLEGFQDLLARPPSEDVFNELIVRVEATNPSPTVRSHLVQRVRDWPSWVHRFVPERWVDDLLEGSLHPAIELCSALDLDRARWALDVIGTRTFRDHDDYAEQADMMRVHNTLSLEQLETLIGTGLLASIEHLFLEYNLSLEYLHLLRAAGPFSFRTLGLDNNPLGDEGVTVVLQLVVDDTLRELCLTDCGITDDGAALLANAPGLTKLEKLELSHNEIGPKGAAALANSPFLPAQVRARWSQVT